MTFKIKELTLAPEVWSRNTQDKIIGVRFDKAANYQELGKKNPSGAQGTITSQISFSGKKSSVARCPGQWRSYVAWLYEKQEKITDFRELILEFKKFGRFLVLLELCQAQRANPIEVNQKLTQLRFLKRKRSKYLIT